MAKELPYYQFEVAEYLTGDIMLCSLDAQGLFGIIKCLYWQKECTLSIKQILRRYNKPDLLDELIEEGCVKVYEKGSIEITFLLSQYNTFKSKRTKRAEAGRKGGLSKKKALLNDNPSKSEAPLKHIEERRVEKSREEKNREEDNIKKAYSKEVHTCYNNCLEYFPTELKPTTVQVPKWTETIDKLNRIDKVEFHQIETVVRRIRADDFWAKNFLSINKLRKKNKEGIMFIVVFSQYLKSNPNGKREQLSQITSSIRAEGKGF